VLKLQSITVKVRKINTRIHITMLTICLVIDVTLCYHLKLHHKHLIEIGTHWKKYTSDWAGVSPKSMWPTSLVQVRDKGKSILRPDVDNVKDEDDNTDWEDIDEDLDDAHVQFLDSQTHFEQETDNIPGLAHVAAFGLS
jgi:hypothetical protein